MYFGFCVRVLVISLLIFGQQAKALSYRSGGSNGITPYFDYSRSRNADTLKPAAAPSAGGYSGSHGRQVDGYNPEGSVSSYGPSQPIIRDPNQLPQANPIAKGILPTKAKAFPLPHNPNSFQSGIASSSAVVMHSGPYSKPQQPKNLPKPKQAGYKPHKPEPQQAANPLNPLQSWYRPKPQHAENPSIPQQSRYQPKPQQTKPNQPSNPQQAKPYQPSYPSNPQQAKPYQPAYPSNPQQPKPHQAKALQGVLQSKAGMWNFPFQGSVASGSNVQSKPYQPAYPLNPQRATNPSSPLQSRYQPKPQHLAYPSNPQQAKPYQPSYPLNPQQAKPYQPAYASNPQQPKPHQAKALQGVLQSKAGMWNFPSQGSVASGSNVQPTDSNSQLNVDPRSLREIPMPFPNQPRWHQQLVPV